VSGIIAPLLAGVLYVAIGLKGIVAIDFVSYFFAIGALLVVLIALMGVDLLLANAAALFAGTIADRALWGSCLRRYSLGGMGSPLSIRDLIP